MRVLASCNALLLGLGLCAPQLAHAVDVEHGVVTVPLQTGPESELTYSYTVETPEGAQPEIGWPVVLLFHGAGQSEDDWSRCHKFRGRDICTMREFKENLHDAGFATVAGSSKEHSVPNLLLPFLQQPPREHWIGWHVGEYEDFYDEQPGTDVYDVPYELRRERELSANPDLQFVIAVLEALGEAKDGAEGPRYDTEDVYAAGISNGAEFTMFVAQYLPELIEAGAVVLGGYAPVIGGMYGPNWNGEIAPDHPPMIVVNTLGLDWVLPIFGIAYKHDLIQSGVQACHFTHLGGIHAWHGEYDEAIIELFSMRQKVLPKNFFCLPRNFGGR